MVATTSLSKPGSMKQSAQRGMYVLRAQLTQIQAEAGEGEKTFPHITIA